MLTYLTLSLMLAAPAGGASKPAATPAGENAPPLIIEVKAADKKVKISVTRKVKMEANGPGNANIVINGGGGIAVNGNAGGGVVVVGPGAGPIAPGAIPAGQVITINMGGDGQMVKKEMAELTEVKDLKIRTVAGKEVTTEEAIKQLANGGVVIAPADGKKIDPKYLKLFAPDVLILTSPELVPASPFGGFMGAGTVNLGGLPGIQVPAIPLPPAAIPVAPPVKE